MVINLGIHYLPSKRFSGLITNLCTIFSKLNNFMLILLLILGTYYKLASTKYFFSVYRERVIKVQQQRNIFYREYRTIVFQRLKEILIG